MHSTACIFQTSLDKTHHWLEKLQNKAEVPDEAAAYKLLRAALHTIRDRIVGTEAMHLASQLPTVLRGSFFEGYKFTKPPSDTHTKEDFLQYFVWKYADRDLDLERAEHLFRCAAETLCEYVSSGEMRDVVGQMPKEVKDLFPAELSKPEWSSSGSQSSEANDDDPLGLNRHEQKRALEMRDRLIQKEGFKEEQANAIVFSRTGKSLGRMDPELVTSYFEETRQL